MEALPAGDVSSAELPPLRNLPHWSRVRTLDRVRYPCSFPQDNMNPLPMSPAEKTCPLPSPLYGNQVVDPNLRVITLEKNLKFLQEQHAETLGKLHKEIEQLKQVNRDLNFRMIMNQRLTYPAIQHSRRPFQPMKPVPPNYTHLTDQPGRRKMEQLEETHTIHEKNVQTPYSRAESNLGCCRCNSVMSSSNQRTTNPKPGEPVQLEERAQKRQTNKMSGRCSCTGPMISLSDAAQVSRKDHCTGRKHSQRGAHRHAVPEDSREQRTAPKEQHKQSTTQRKLSIEAANRRSNERVVSQRDCAAFPVPSLHPELEKAQMFITSLTPLLIQINPSGSPRAPTLQECGIIVRHLLSTSSQRTQELLRLKASLKDLLHSKKWTPDACLLAKAYLTELSQDQAAVQLPKVPSKESARKLPEATVTTADRVILPALKLSVGNRATEQQRRLQAMQKNRFRKVLL